MKKKYLIASAVVGLALLTGAAAFAQTNVPGNTNAITPTVAAPATGAQSVGTLPGQGNNAARAGFGGGAMTGRFNNASSRRMVGVNYAPSRSSRGGGILIVLRMFAMAITMIMVWIIMLLVIGLLGFKLKKIKSEFKNESKK
jgi:hypothetical protein